MFLFLEFEVLGTNLNTADVLNNNFLGHFCSFSEYTVLWKHKGSQENHWWYHKYIGCVWAVYSQAFLCLRSDRC